MTEKLQGATTMFSCCDAGLSSLIKIGFLPSEHNEGSRQGTSTVTAYKGVIFIRIHK